MLYRLLLLVVCGIACVEAAGQYYFRGEVRDPQQNLLPYVRIHVHSTNAFYYSGSEGSFGIPSSRITDTVTLYLNGYVETSLVLNGSQFNQLELKPRFSGKQVQRRRLLSVTKDKIADSRVWWSAGGETYSQQVENECNSTAQYPTTGFAMNVDKASYSNIRRFLQMKSAVPPDAVRIEEMLNYFPQRIPAPEAGETFRFRSQLTDCPWSPAKKLLFLQLHARKISFDHLPPGNFVFLIDISGSMDLPNRLPLLKTAFRMLVENLRPVDTISVVVYGGTVGVMLQPTSGSDKKRIMNVIDSLVAGGDTPGESAIRMAYNLAQRTFIKGGNNRIILATDGDFNVGEVSEESLMNLVHQKQQTGIFLTCLGVGMGNYKDSKLEALAKKGNGNFAYLDHVNEAEKVLVTELTQTLFSVANDAFLNVTFNPAAVQSYRLLGYDNRKDALADSTVMVEGGEIGSGHTVTAVFELVPQPGWQQLVQPVAAAELSYVAPATNQKITETYSCNSNYVPLSQADTCYRFNAGVVLFGLLLKQSAFVEQSQWEMLQRYLPGSVYADDLHQQELLQLAATAKEIYSPSRSRKLKAGGKKKKTAAN